MKAIVKITYTIIAIATFFSFLTCAGCDSAEAKLPAGFASGSNQLSGYGPVKADIMPLTEFVHTGDEEKPSKIRTYVSLLDEFDCQIKAPAVFRFELYNKVLRSSEPKGKRVFIWPDIDLNEPDENNEYWQDFLRAYQFDLDFAPEEDQSYILEVTSLCPDGKRLSAEFTLKYGE